MSEKDWTWMEKYRAWFRPKATRICSNCDYKGYFKLKDAMIMVPGRPPFLEICPKCDYEIELKEGENPCFYHPNPDKIEKIAREQGLTIQEVIDEAFENIILELDPKIGRFRLVNKITGREIKFDASTASENGGV